MSLNFRISSEILLRLYFPHFSSPKETRFSILFSSLTKSQKKLKKTTAIFPERIISGKDKRTSILIRNLPKDMTRNKLYNILAPFGNINFCFIPTKKGSNVESKCAFVNAINYKTIANIFLGLQKINENLGINKNNISDNSNDISDNEKDSLKNIKITYSYIQTKQKLVERFYFNQKDNQ